MGREKGSCCSVKQPASQHVPELNSSRGLADWRYLTSVQQAVAPAEVKTMPSAFLPIWKNLQKKLLDSLCSGVGKFIALQVLPVPN